MSRKSFGRRGFLKGAAAAAALPIAGVPAAEAQQAADARSSGAPLMSKAAETQTPPNVEVLTDARPGSDFMVDIFKSLGFEYICANPGSSFRGLHESIINYGNNKNPELITCCHEESAVAMAHGFAKVEGKPIGVMLHGPVGLQHGAMAIYNAYCDGRGFAASRGRMGAQRSGWRGHGPGFHQVGRYADLANALRGIRRACL